MVKFDVDGVQNVEVSKKFPCEKSMAEQLEIMKLYTEVHKKMSCKNKERREIECLKILFPKLLRRIDKQDLFAGRMDFLPIGFGSVTSVGGVGHYCVFNKLREFQKQLTDNAEKEAVDELYNYWLNNDLKTKYCNEILTETTIGRFVDCEYPLIATARLSGMMLDYQKLLDLGIDGLKNLITTKLLSDSSNAFLLNSIAALDLFVECAEFLKDDVLSQMGEVSNKRKIELLKIAMALDNIKSKKPQTFLEALQLFWLYALLSGCINYGRLDDNLGPFLAADLANGTLAETEAYEYVKCLWTMVENRRTTVNGRIIVGGKGRKHPKEADVFLHIALKVAKDTRYVEPQFTLRVDKNTADTIWNEALDALGQGATYPTLYNDDVNIPAVQFGMRIDEKTAEQYVPFGCTEFVIQGQSTGTPNVCMNVLKMLTLMFNEGIDPMDGKRKNGTVKIKPVSEYLAFNDFYENYKELLNYYIDISAKAQYYSYEVMRRDVSFIFTSILMNSCIDKGKALLDGGVKYLGGTNEIYGLINASDSLVAIKKLVFEEKKYTLSDIKSATLANFIGFEKMRKDLWNCDKYGNDLEDADRLAADLYEYIAKGVRDSGIKIGMQYFLVVISNNQLNTEWGKCTGASADGRVAALYMNPANNPQGGADKNGPTAMLNSLVKIDPKYHAGSVQNIKFSPTLFNENREMIKALFKAYFKKGGCHIMVTVVGRGVLEDAVKHPEKYQNLVVRVSGFSAIFVNLDPDVQKELMSRVTYE